MAHKTVFWGLLLLLLFLPLPLGSVLEWAQFVFEVGVIILFLVHYFGTMLERRGAMPAAAAVDFRDSRATSGRLPSLFRAMVVVFLAFGVFELIPLPPGLMKILSPITFRTYAAAAGDGVPGLSASSWHTLSLHPAASLGKLGLIVCLGLFAFLVLKTVRSRREMEIFVLALLAAGLFQAFYGMAETFSGRNMIFGLKKRTSGYVSGTFYNRNHFAGFLEMVFPISLGYVLAKTRYFSMDRGLSLREKILWFSQEKVQWALLFGLASVFMGVALVFSQSRSGVTVFLMVLFLAVAAATGWRDLTAGDGGAASRPRATQAVRLVALAVIGISAWIGLGPLIARFSQTDMDAAMRRVFYRDTLRIIADHPLFGTGPGTYVDVYGMYEKKDDNLRLSYAHNDYLELAAENGLVAGAAAVILAVGMAVVIAGRWRSREDDFARGIGLGSLLALIAILLHAFTDFNLQIPANAAYFVAIAALGFNAVTFGARRRKEPPAGDRGLEMSGQVPGRSRPLTAAAAVLPLVLLGVCARDYLGFHYRDLYLRTRLTVRSVESGFPVLEPILLEAVHWSDRADVRIELARLYFEMARAAQAGGREEVRDDYCDRAINEYDRAIRSDPANGFSYYESGLAYLTLDYPLAPYADKARSRFRAAIRVKPADEFLHLNIICIYLASWGDLEPADRDYAAGIYRRMAAAVPGFTGRLKARWVKSYGGDGSALDAILANMAGSGPAK